MENTKPKRNPRRRKKSAVLVSRKEGVQLVTELEKPEVTVLEQIVEEPEVTVKQPFTEPVFNVIPEDIFQQAKVLDAVNELPKPLMAPTQRQYGEDFLPLYIKSRNKLRRLAGLP